MGVHDPAWLLAKFTHCYPYSLGSGLQNRLSLAEHSTLQYRDRFPDRGPRGCLNRTEVLRGEVARAKAIASNYRLRSFTVAKLPSLRRAILSKKGCWHRLLDDTDSNVLTITGSSVVDGLLLARRHCRSAAAAPRRRLHDASDGAAFGGDATFTQCRGRGTGGPAPRKMESARQCAPGGCCKYRLDPPRP